MVAGCGFHHLHCIDVELIVHHLIFLKCVNFLGTLDSWLDPVKTFCISVEKEQFFTLRFLMVVSTEMAWAAILVKTLFSIVNLSYHYLIKESPNSTNDENTTTIPNCLWKCLWWRGNLWVKWICCLSVCWRTSPGRGMWTKWDLLKTTSFTWNTHKYFPQSIEIFFSFLFNPIAFYTFFAVNCKASSTRRSSSKTLGKN